MKKQTNWIAIGVVVIVAIVAAYFGSLIGRGALLAPANSGGVVPDPICYGGRFGLGSAHYNMYPFEVPYEYDPENKGRDAAVIKSYDLAIEKCESAVESETKEMKDFLADSIRDCPLEKCEYDADPKNNFENTLSKEACVVTYCDVYEEGERCRYNVDPVTKKLIEPPIECGGERKWTLFYVACDSDDGRWEASPECVPKLLSTQSDVSER